MHTDEIITGPEEFRDRFDVSRETLERLSVYVDLLTRWQKRINLVGRSTIDNIWSRHIADSAQLIEHMPRVPCSVIDLGSGAGLPGVILAILFGEYGAGESDHEDSGLKGTKADFPVAGQNNGHVHLIESNTKKCAFLREAVRLTGAPATIHTCRIEHLNNDDLNPEPEVVTARALASLTDLLGMAEKYMDKGAKGVFLKGQDVDDELTEASKYWRISVDRMPSRIHDQGSILIVREATRVDI